MLITIFSITSEQTVRVAKTHHSQSGTGSNPTGRVRNWLCDNAGSNDAFPSPCCIPAPLRCVFATKSYQATLLHVLFVTNSTETLARQISFLCAKPPQQDFRRSVDRWTSGFRRTPTSSLNWLLCITDQKCPDKIYIFWSGYCDVNKWRKSSEESLLLHNIHRNRTKTIKMKISTRERSQV